MKVVELLNKVESIADARYAFFLTLDASRLCSLLRSGLNHEAEVLALLESVVRKYVSMQKWSVTTLLSCELVKAIDIFLDENVYRKFGVSIIGKTLTTTYDKLPRLISGQLVTDFDRSRLFDPVDAADELAMSNVICTLVGRSWLLHALPFDLAELESKVSALESYQWLRTALGEKQLYSSAHRTEAHKRKMVRTLLQLQNDITVVWREAGKEPSEVPHFFIPLCYPTISTAEQDNVVTNAQRVIRAAAEAYRPPASPRLEPSTAELMSDATAVEGYQLFVQDQKRMKRFPEADIGLFRTCYEGELRRWLKEPDLCFLAIARACLREDDGSGLLNQLLPQPTSVWQHREAEMAPMEITIDPAKLSRDWIVLSEKERGDRLLAQWVSLLQLHQLDQGSAQPVQAATVLARQVLN